MAKECEEHFRVERERKELRKKLGLTVAEIYDVGWDNLVPKKKDELKRLAKHHKEMWTHYKNLWTQYNKEKQKKSIKLDEICKQYLGQGRPIDNPGPRDKFWIKARIKDNKLFINQEEFLQNCKKIREGF